MEEESVAKLSAVRLIEFRVYLPSNRNQAKGLACNFVMQTSPNLFIILIKISLSDSIMLHRLQR